MIILEDYALVHCFRLTSVILPSSLLGIEKGAFEGLSITSIVIPNEVEYIGDDAFKSCSSLKSIRLPMTLKMFGNSAFFNCESLEFIVIPDSTTIEPLYTMEEREEVRLVAKSSRVALDNPTGYPPFLDYFHIPSTFFLRPIASAPYFLRWMCVARRKWKTTDKLKQKVAEGVEAEKRRGQKVLK